VPRLSDFPATFQRDGTISRLGFEQAAIGSCSSLRRAASETLTHKGKKRHSRPVPGDRLQIDVYKIVPAVYQDTAINDCSRSRVLGV
jgi:hypothetical protein